MALLIKTKIYVQVGTERPTKLMLVMELLLFYKSIFYRACHSNICIIYYISITLIFISRSVAQLEELLGSVISACEQITRASRPLAKDQQVLQTCAQRRQQLGTGLHLLHVELLAEEYGGTGGCQLLADANAMRDAGVGHVDEAPVSIARRLLIEIVLVGEGTDLLDQSVGQDNEVLPGNVGGMQALAEFGVVPGKEGGVILAGGVQGSIGRLQVGGYVLVGVLSIDCLWAVVLVAQFQIVIEEGNKLGASPLGGSRVNHCVLQRKPIWLCTYCKQTKTIALAQLQRQVITMSDALLLRIGVTNFVGMKVALRLKPVIVALKIGNFILDVYINILFAFYLYANKCHSEFC